MKKMGLQLEKPAAYKIQRLLSEKAWCLPSVVPYRGSIPIPTSSRSGSRQKENRPKQIQILSPPIRSCFSIYRIPHFLEEIVPTVSNLTASECRAKTTGYDLRRIHPSAHSLYEDRTYMCCSLQLTPDHEQRPLSLPALVRK